jgi:cysteinyl-tRNA synthetase
MAKSKGNFFQLSDVLAKGYDAGEIRFLLLSTHYRKGLNFTDEALQQARTSRNRIRNFLFELRHVERDLPPNPAAGRAIEAARAAFVAGLEDDLNISEALAALFELVRSVNILVAQGALGREDAGRVIAFVKELDKKILACLADESGVPAGARDLETWIREKIDSRQKARADKDFKRADEIRNELLEADIVLEDTKDGVRWKSVGPAKP